MPIEKVLYTAHSKATGGREGKAPILDGAVELRLTTPKELGGGGAVGTNPEQLFAAGYSACFLGAMKFVANRDKLKISPDVSVEGHVSIGPLPTGFGLAVELKISNPGLTKEEAEELAKRAHIVCPYSNATRGNINVTTTIV